VIGGLYQSHPVCLCSAMPALALVVKHAPPLDDQGEGWHPLGQAGGMAERIVHPGACPSGEDKCSW
jgi:hypothetical protein